MTLSEYAEQVSEQIFKAANSYQANSILTSAVDDLQQANISRASQQQFWVEVYELVEKKAVPIMAKSQSAAALNALIADAKNTIEDLYRRCAS